MKIKTWLIAWFMIVVVAFTALGSWVYSVDPFFHYHKPHLDKYFYVLNNERSQNDGIIKHFDYNAMITGTSMTQNFKTTECDEIFGVKSIKVPFVGGTYKEINENIEKALINNPGCKTVIRGIDVNRLIDAADEMRLDLGEYPTYLYDNNPFNDVNYLLNRDIVFGRVYYMYDAAGKEGFKPGMTSFDKYSRQQEGIPFGYAAVKNQSADSFEKDTNEVTNEKDYLKDWEKERIKEGVLKNIVSLADKYPDVTFYYFFTPYSAAAWRKRASQRGLHKRVDAMEYAAELIVPHENIRMFSFDTRFDITTDLNNYKDNIHYASWVNSLMLRWMHDDKYRLTEDNYKDVFKEIYDFYEAFDYDSLSTQVDYEADNLAGALLNQELTGAEPVDLMAVENSYVTWDSSDAKVTVDLADGHNFLSFTGCKQSESGECTCAVYNEEGKMLANADDIKDDNDSHQYVIDLSNYAGTVTVEINGFTISELILY